ncbi:MAG: NADP-dependent isocitrate dehydrogenase [Candidatus Eremiobacter antarcticus]|nr:NADP-dependent isocitrate dehydrogenase [Candidatus Eremiobacteraeota bacterium]MBC5807906.1 NADP-dependent isocitrate dehydrogenase [Candidatus Eremiobacteraeota bacterium]PZR62725.1 MAG: NADP-dependent isocitrate dehydrogenase [Candidatus Eremiobacter sp. RRmetagenome_bin22]
MHTKTPITVAYGDGIGPEIMQATLDVIMAGGAQLDLDIIDIGEKVYLSGEVAGIQPSSWDSLRRTKVFLKAPITTPQGGGFKSLNVTTRTTLGLYANVRPCVSYDPFIRTKHPGMNVIIVRENEEDVYGGIEYRQTQQMAECLRLISRPGTERIVRFAFEYARRNNRKKVTCFAKDNIMKITDGLFHRIFDEIAGQYADLEHEFWIVDIGAAKLADTPQAFDVVVLPNLYGDILSDVAAQIAGSVGLAGSANIGDMCSMFEAIHGSAPRRAGQNVANPSGLMQGAILMLVHIGQSDVASRVQNAWLKTIEDGIHTYDIYKEGVSRQKVGTKEFAAAVIARLGQQPGTLPAAHYAAADEWKAPPLERPRSERKVMVGVDVYVEWNDGKPQDLGSRLRQVGGATLELDTIFNRGTIVWPSGLPETFCTDHWRARFLATNGKALEHGDIVTLLTKVNDAGFDCIKTENLYTFDGVPGYSSAEAQ